MRLSGVMYISPQNCRLRGQQGCLVDGVARIALEVGPGIERVDQQLAHRPLVPAEARGRRVATEIFDDHRQDKPRRRQRGAPARPAARDAPSQSSRAWLRDECRAWRGASAPGGSRAPRERARGAGGHNPNGSCAGAQPVRDRDPSACWPSMSPVRRREG